ncbi:hypothetical protein STVA_11180 [Allostella vacuolata]|nr:hypothetical protein STVA_11180 [Stella vacuolata]
MTAGEGLWDFSLRVYGTPSIAKWCLRLQDEHGADVNILLWCAWAGSQGVRLTADDLAAAEAATAAWRDQVVLPLRALRRALKRDLGQVSADAAVALRTRIKGVELEAERLQQAALERLPQGRRRPGRGFVETAIADNIALYQQALGAPAGDVPDALPLAARSRR